ncbi:hypothetical protein [Agrobacterium tumefaciens]|uniref:hypothetical protein n=1 Tax=Agrobacterium tumefaciens TaxID=358 RepID=UPI0015747143|nr:hypothetical protein [Agrobacterium tumefaciens]NTA41124.1 hypothetical protein [Agrobacterium tumefaciens]WIE32640.1 hypothetical protein G6L82_000895 [Agrobacterium tumefaciens]
MIYFFASGNTPFTLSIFNSKCYVRDEDGDVAFFESISFQENDTVLQIDHFALTTDLRNKGRAEEVLRAFAELVAVQKPAILEIKFSLHRRLTGDIQSLADGRERLLRRIGAIDVWQERPNSYGVIVVHGRWRSDDW